MKEVSNFSKRLIVLLVVLLVAIFSLLVMIVKGERSWFSFKEDNLGQITPGIEDDDEDDHGDYGGMICEYAPRDR